MTEQTPSPDHANANEAHLAMRKAHREARYLLERAGLLRRRKRT